MNRLPSLAVILSISIIAAASAHANAYVIGDDVVVRELGVGLSKVVAINVSGLGSLTVHAGIVRLTINGVATNGLCIDPYQWSNGSPQPYVVADLLSAPLPPMGSAAALTVSKLWADNFSMALSDASTAAGLQIAIWEAVAGNHFSVVGNDYGAAEMIASARGRGVGSSLIAVTSSRYQDYAVAQVPESASTLALLSFGFVGLAAFRRKARRLA